MLLILADATQPALFGLVGLLGAATITGWFSVRANRQATEAQTTKSDTLALRGEIALALDVVKDLTGQIKNKDAQIVRLHRQLDDCRSRRR